jgi:hypothetical protein
MRVPRPPDRVVNEPEPLVVGEPQKKVVNSSVGTAGGSPIEAGNDRESPADTARMPVGAARRIPPAGPARDARGVDGVWWTAEDGRLIKEGIDQAAVSFGDVDWTDYDLTFEARKSAGPGGLGAHFRFAGGKLYLLILGDISNKRHSLGRYSRSGGGNTIRSTPGSIQLHRWYKVKISLRGPHIRIELDDQLLFDVKDEFSKSGCVAPKCWGSAGRFRNIKVTAPDGTVLWEGPPDLPEK